MFVIALSVLLIEFVLFVQPALTQDLQLGLFTQGMAVVLQL